METAQVGAATVMQAGFTAHNVRLDDGSFTYPEAGATIDQMGNYICVRNMLQVLYPEGWAGRSIVDLGCLEGGFATEFARLGLASTGIEVRESNFRHCQTIKAGVSLENLSFIRDDAWNVRSHGPFDIVFCVGLYYHIADVRRFLAEMAGTCRKAIFIDTHLAPELDGAPAVARHNLSPLDEHEGMAGRWYAEHDLDAEADTAALDALKWASWDNKRSFWPTKGALITAMRHAGFDIVLEDYDPLGLAAERQMSTGPYSQHNRTMLVGIKL